jgi:hypothetical protein
VLREVRAGASCAGHSSARHSCCRAWCGVPLESPVRSLRRLRVRLPTPPLRPAFAACRGRNPWPREQLDSLPHPARALRNGAFHCGGSRRADATHLLCLSIRISEHSQEQPRGSVPIRERAPPKWKESVASAFIVHQPPPGTGPPQVLSEKRESPNRFTPKLLRRES